MAVLAEIVTVARKKAPKTVPVRLTEEAIRWAKRASGLTEESMGGYISRVVTERAEQDFERLSDAIRKGKPKGGKA